MKQNRIGIYKITNLKNNKSYVGKSVNIDKRWKDHKSSARRGEQKHLYNSMRHYGITYFQFSILEECEFEKLEDREKFYIATLTPEYNKTPGGSGGDTFTKMTPEAKIIRRNKISGKNHPQYGKPLTDHQKQALSKSTLGVPKSKEHKENLSKAKLGKPLSEEHRKNISKSLMGNVRNLGKKQSEATKNKKSIANKAFHANKHYLKWLESKNEKI